MTTTLTPIRHITLEELQSLPDGQDFYAAFGPAAPAHDYVMGPELRSHVTYRAHLVFGAWAGACTHEAGEYVDFVRTDSDVICGGCHHRHGNHPVCKTFSWLNVLCGGKHVKL